MVGLPEWLPITTSRMKTQLFSFLLAVVGAACLMSCANKPAPITMPVSQTYETDSSLATQVFQQVNAFRAQQGATSLPRHAGLDRLAQKHCEYLRQHRGTFSLYGKNVSHIGFEGRALFARESYHMDNLGENVAAAKRSGANPAATLVGLWKDSKEHRHNMLNNWTCSGIAVVVDSDGMMFSTQLFATMNHNPLDRRARFSRF